jgi:diguanylate cyclase (GGDEF)-like protein
LPDDLRKFKEQLRRNERIWTGFRRIELRLIGAGSLREMVDVLTQELTRHFGGVKAVSLACLDPEYEIARLVEGCDAITPSGRLSSRSGETGGVAECAFISLQPGELQRVFPTPYRPYLGSATSEMRQLLFPSVPERLASVALAPLVRHGQLIGCLSQGSLDAQHFTPDAATDLLEHLAAVTALCVENAVSHERLKADGLTDPLTGIANRRFFERRLHGEVERWRRTRQATSVLLADIDYFKRVNDTYGHRVGDEVLKRVAAAFAGELRAADVLARFGGEEFAFLLPQTTASQALVFAERVRARIESHSWAGNVSLPATTVSVGVSSLDDKTSGGADLRDWLVERADRALYWAKGQGRNRVCHANQTTVHPLATGSA